MGLGKTGWWWGSLKTCAEWGTRWLSPQKTLAREWAGPSAHGVLLTLGKCASGPRCTALSLQPFLPQSRVHCCLISSPHSTWYTHHIVPAFFQAAVSRVCPSWQAEGPEAWDHVSSRVLAPDTTCHAVDTQIFLERELSKLENREEWCFSYKSDVTLFQK